MPPSGSMDPGHRKELTQGIRSLPRLSWTSTCKRVVTASVSDELRDFIAAHREHGQLTGDATEPGLAGYQVWIACPCGVTFRHQVTRKGTRSSTWPSWPD